MNVYYAGNPIVAHIELLRDGKPWPDLTGWTPKVALLKSDYTLAVAERTADIDQPGDSNITASFTAAETAALTTGTYYLRARITHATLGPETFRPEAISIQVVA